MNNKKSTIPSHRPIPPGIIAFRRGVHQEVLLVLSMDGLPSLKCSWVCCFVWTWEKNMSCTLERSCLGLTVRRLIPFAFLADKTNKQTVSATYIIYSILYVVLRDYLFHYLDFLWTQQIKRVLISSVCLSDCFFCTSNQGTVIILTSVCITGNENRNLRLSEHCEFS